MCVVSLDTSHLTKTRLVMTTSLREESCGDYLMLCGHTHMFCFAVQYLVSDQICSMLTNTVAFTNRDPD